MNPETTWANDMGKRDQLDGCIMRQPPFATFSLGTSEGWDGAFLTLSRKAPTC
jgi:hypothetical protein